MMICRPSAICASISRLDMVFSAVLERRQASLGGDIRNIARYDNISAFNWRDLLVERVLGWLEASERDFREGSTGGETLNARRSPLCKSVGSRLRCAKASSSEAKVRPVRQNTSGHWFSTHRLEIVNDGNVIHYGLHLMPHGQPPDLQRFQRLNQLRIRIRTPYPSSRRSISITHHVDNEQTPQHSPPTACRSQISTIQCPFSNWFGEYFRHRSSDGN